MAVNDVRAFAITNSVEVAGSGLRTGLAQAAVDHALQLRAKYAEPAFATKILFTGSFVDPAFAELSQLTQQHCLNFDSGGGWGSCGTGLYRGLAGRDSPYLLDFGGMLDSSGMADWTLPGSTEQASHSAA